MLYQLYKIDGVLANAVIRDDRLGVRSFIPFDPDNSDFVAFKQAINDDTAQLEDADGVLMSAEEATAFIKELP